MKRLARGGDGRVLGIYLGRGLRERVDESHLRAADVMGRADESGEEHRPARKDGERNRVVVEGRVGEVVEIRDTRLLQELIPVSQRMGLRW